jgi:hypothetical protein
MRKFIITAVVIVILISVLFAGCANQILYGTWKMTETINAKTFESSEPMFANMMVFRIYKNGTVEFLDEEFGTFTKSRNQFTFIETSDEDDDDEELLKVSGAWELDGGDLYIYPDETPVIYHLVRLQDKVE